MTPRLFSLPLIAFLWLFIPPAMAAEPSVETTSSDKVVGVVTLQNRLAEPLIPILKPFLAESDILQADRYRLVIETDPERWEKINQLLAQLDTAPARLAITLRQSVADVTDPKIMKIIRRSTHAKSVMPDNLTLQTVEHETVVFQLQRSVPVVALVSMDPQAPMAIFNERITTNTLALSARRHGGKAFIRVYAEITPSQTDGAAHGLQQQKLVSRLTGNLGEWIPLVARNDETQGKRILRTTPRQTTWMPLWIKVDALQ